MSCIINTNNILLTVQTAFFSHQKALGNKTVCKKYDYNTVLNILSNKTFCEKYKNQHMNHRFLEMFNLFV